MDLTSLNSRWVVGVGPGAVGGVSSLFRSSMGYSPVEFLYDFQLFARFPPLAR